MIGGIIGAFGFFVDHWVVGVFGGLLFFGLVEGFNGGCSRFAIFLFFGFHLATGSCFASTNDVDNTSAHATRGGATNQRIESLGVLTGVLGLDLKIVGGATRAIGGFAWIVKQGFNYRASYGAT